MSTSIQTSRKTKSSIKPKKIIEDPIKNINTDEKIDASFILRNLNISHLDRSYALPEISRKQEREVVDFMRPQKIEEENNDAKGVTTSLERLGISTAKKDPVETIYWGDHYKINLYINEGNGNQYELTHERKIKCTWCHQYPPEGSLMLAVPYKFVSNYIHEHVYAPECVNIVTSIDVEPSKSMITEKSKKTDPKSAPKMNYFKRDLTNKDKEAYSSTDKRIVINNYFETAKPVCSFNCMESKRREIVERDPRFKNARMHMAHLYQLIFGVLPGKIIPASSYETLKEYGGDHTVEEFRRNFKIITLHDMNQYYTRARSLMNSSIGIFTAVNNNL